MQVKMHYSSPTTTEKTEKSEKMYIFADLAQDLKLTSNFRTHAYFEFAFKWPFFLS